MATPKVLPGPSGDRWPQRQLIVLDGERDQGLRAAGKLILERKPERPIWISNAPVPELLSSALCAADGDAARRLNANAMAPTKVQRLLGGECDLLIIDIWSGLDADALGAAVGSLRGGGLLLLLTPALADWSDWVDPDAARLAVYPYSAAEVGTRFIARCSRLLRAYIAAQRSDDDGSPTARHSLAARPGTGADPAQPATPDQAQAIAAIHALARGRARRPLVLTADRGRGKSAALGIAAGRLIAEQKLPIIVSAPRRSAAEPLFEHATAALRLAAAAELDGLLSFQAPDALLANRPPAALLLVDEAAGIPAPLLEQLLGHYRRICFATTVHGYEGSGRGFDVRFRALLDQRAPGWRALRLQSPIRWRQDDRLERLINRVLLLDAEPATDARIPAAELTTARVERHDRASLAADERLLQQLFGLLVLGHYQTRPNDLRLLLDGPNLEVASLTIDGLVLATALIAHEGRLPPSLSQPIFEGRRRPRGHLLPQTLSAHAGLHEAPSLGFVRIVRIAVHPAARRQGLGRRLVAAIAAQARRDGGDLLGASFGASSGLLAFWRRCGLAPLHLGLHRNAASGAQAAVVLEALSPAGAGLLVRARERLKRDLPILLTGPLRDTEPALIAALLSESPCDTMLVEPWDWQQIDAFADAHRTLEAALPALERLVRSRLCGSYGAGLAEMEERTDKPALANRDHKTDRASGTDCPIAGSLSTTQRDLLILSILQRRSPEAVVAAAGLSGYAELLRQLRQAIATLRGPGH